MEQWKRRHHRRRPPPHTPFVMEQWKRRQYGRRPPPRRCLGHRRVPLSTRQAPSAAHARQGRITMVAPSLRVTEGGRATLPPDRPDAPRPIRSTSPPLKTSLQGRSERIGNNKRPWTAPAPLHMRGGARLPKTASPGAIARAWRHMTAKSAKTVKTIGLAPLHMRGGARPPRPVPPDRFDQLGRRQLTSTPPSTLSPGTTHLPRPTQVMAPSLEVW